LTIIMPVWLANLLTALLCGFSLWKGGSEERLFTFTLLANAALTIGLRDLSWPHVQWQTFVLDAVTLAVFLAVSFRTERYWPLFATGFQVLGVVTHMAKLIDPSLQQWAYLTAGIIWTYLQMFAIAAGAWNSWRWRQRVKAEAGAADWARR
jgi:hypothetical protein